MAKKDLKINITNTQLAQALQLDKLKKKLADKKAGAEKKPAAAKAEKAKETSSKVQKQPVEPAIAEVEESPRRKARSRSAFAEPEKREKELAHETAEAPYAALSQEEHPLPEEIAEEAPQIQVESLSSSDLLFEEVQKELPEVKSETPPPPAAPLEKKEKEEKVVLGPTGRHIKDLLPPKYPEKKGEQAKEKPAAKTSEEEAKIAKDKTKKAKEEGEASPDSDAEKRKSKAKFKEFRDLKPVRRSQVGKFDSRDRQGLREGDEDSRWRKRKSIKAFSDQQDELTIRPKELKVRVPISVKDLASAMKLKSSQLIQKLFLQGIILTLNDILEDETTIQLLGQEFDCEITLDTSEEERMRITDQTVREEIRQTDSALLKPRAPVVTFMGHVDHGKTSLIDYIRSSSIAAGEAGAITQHIGAFLCQTAVGPIAILDTPGHEAFSQMRARGADVTDIVVLVIAGDEGIRAQTEEAINHAKAAGVTIVVAANKCDKPNFDIELVNRQLAEHDLLPEAWGGQTITVPTSAATGKGVNELLEMLALQAEVLELNANPSARARGAVLESELHKGMGCVATILVQNGTLRIGDSLVFGEHWGRVKTMRDEFGKTLTEAPPSAPVEITGLSGLPEAGEDFIVVSSEKEARAIAEARMINTRQRQLLQSKRSSLENIFQEAADKKKKVLRIVLRADTQGSLEALKAALLKIESEKAETDIISAGIGEISESDVLLAAASHAIILGFHTQIESHAESLMKQHHVFSSLHDIIYHAIDKVKELMAGLLDKIAVEVEKGKAEVRATFKSSQLGVIAGCLVTEGTIHRNHYMRVRRGGEVVWKGQISSLKRVKDDVREVQKGVECGILLTNFPTVQEGDILESYEINYISQEL